MGVSLCLIIGKPCYVFLDLVLANYLCQKCFFQAGVPK